MNKVKAIICAAGVGKRLRPLTNNCPKPLLQIGDKSILEHMLDSLSENGISEIVIIVGYKAELIKNKIGNVYRNCSVKYIYNGEYGTTNNIYSLWLARNEITNGMIFLNADIVFHSAIIKNLLEDNYPDSLIIDPEIDLQEDAMKVKFKNGRLTEIGKELSGEPDGWAFGIYKLSQNVSEKYFLIAKKLFNNQKNKNISFVAPLREIINEIDIKATSSKNYKWAEIDTYEDYKRAEEIIKEIKSI